MSFGPGPRPSLTDRGEESMSSAGHCTVVHPTLWHGIAHQLRPCFVDSASGIYCMSTRISNLGSEQAARSKTGGPVRIPGRRNRSRDPQGHFEPRVFAFAQSENHRLTRREGFRHGPWCIVVAVSARSLLCLLHPLFH